MFPPSAHPCRRLLVAALALCAHAAQAGGHTGPACAAPEGDFFLEEVWTKVGALSCLKCHKAGGDAEDSHFVLRDPSTERAEDPAGWREHNRAAFQKVALQRTGGHSRLLVKATGGLDHGGEAVLKPDSIDYRILTEYVRRLDAPGSAPALAGTARPARPFFEGVAMLDDRRLLRRLTLSLAGRLPRAEELAAVERQGLDAFGPVLDAAMREDAFYERLAEGFNDIFLIRGYDNGAESALSYDHFSTTRYWTQKFDLSEVGDAAAQQKARYKLTDDYREALLREPLELIKYIVREGHPFTEIVTADYIMVSPYTARGYGIFEQVRERFQNPQDPFEYIPAQLPSLKNRTGRDHQESETGLYPHAGLLSTFQYLRRYPTTETNRNRLRARMYYAQFLGIDVLELAARVTDAAAVSAKFAVPTMEAPECVVCHKTVDPVAGIFQDYYSLEGVYGPRKTGWFQDMFGPGLEGENLPREQRWRALQWLGERTARDPRFASTMVEHVYYLLTGRKVLLPPKALDDPFFTARQRAYDAQHAEVARIAGGFVKSNFDLKEVFKAWALSPYYRAETLTAPASDPERQAELADVGIARLLGPEQLGRKIAAIFGRPWRPLHDPQLALLYGGIDAREVTERATDPSGAMGAIQRAMADEVACKNVAADFAREPRERRLFPEIEADVAPDGTPGTEARLRQAIVHLHELVLGRYQPPDDPDVTRTFELFKGIVEEARGRSGLDSLEIYSCRTEDAPRPNDPQYTLRAWRGVLTYLLRQQEFLYE